MNIKIIGAVGMTLVVIIASGFFLARDEAHVSSNATTALAPAAPQAVEATVNASDFVSLRPEVTALPEQSISTEEREGLVFMREEEKLARDVYSVLFDKWGLQIFSNIAQSEQTHTEAVKTLLTKYNIVDPVKVDDIGEFENPDLKKLYVDLTAKGMVSLNEALTVGVIIEELDIADLKIQISKTDNDDIKLVYENLLRGSRNHLRSFMAQLSSRNGTYVPQYLSQEEFDEIIASSQERGGGGGNGRGWGKN